MPFKYRSKINFIKYPTGICQINFVRPLQYRNPCLRLSEKLSPLGLLWRQMPAGRLALYIVLLALGVRLGLLAVRGPMPPPTPWQFSFEDGIIAKWIVLGEGFSSPYYDHPRPTAVMAPAYPFWLAGLFSVFGIFSRASAWVALGVQSLLGALSCWALWRLGAALANPPAGLLAAFLLALYPPALYYSMVQIGPTMLTAFLLLVVLWLLWTLRGWPSLRRTTLCGVLVGLCLLVKPAIVTAVIGALAWGLLSTRRRRLWQVGLALLVLVVAAATVFPWTLRNRLALGHWTPIKTVAGLNLFFGNHPLATGVLQDTEAVFTPTSDGLRIAPHPDAARHQLREKLLDMPYETFAGLDEVTQDRHLRQQALTFIRAQPLRFLRLVALRCFYFWWPVHPYRATAYDNMRLVVYGSLAICAVFGLVWWPADNTSRLFLFFAIACYPIPYMLTHVSYFRYRLPIEPLIILLASVFLIQFWRMIVRYIDNRFCIKNEEIRD